MAVELDLAKAIARRGIDDAERTAPIADENMPVGRIVSDVVGVVGQLDALDALERGAVKQVAGVALPIGDKELVEFGNETYTLRLVQSADALGTHTYSKIHNLHR